MLAESRVHRSKRFRVVSSAAAVVFSRPVVIWSISGRSQAAVDTFLQLWNLPGLPAAGASILGEDGHDVGQVLAGEPFSFEYARGWRCERGLAFAGSSTEETFTADASEVLMRIEYEFARDEDGGA